MKVILTAFSNKLQSVPLEFPDEIGVEIHLMMDMDSRHWLGSSREDSIPNKITSKRGTFVYNGQSQLLIDDTFARIYVLTNIN